MKYPHDGVYTRIKRSKKHGVGVFAIAHIIKGTHVFRGDENTKTVEIAKSAVKGLPKPLRKMYRDFCPLNNGTYTCPENFNQMPISWYLNSSKKPNVECREDLLFYALKDIKAGTELTVDYETYSE